MEDGKNEFLSLRLGWINAIHLNDRREVTKDIWFSFTTSKQFFDFVESFNGKKREPVYIFAHNAAFDFSVLGGITALPERKHIIKRNMIADTVFLLDTWLDNGDRHFIWLDTMNFARDSLKNIGKELGIPKTEPSGGKIHPVTGERIWSAKEWNEIPTEKMSVYCRNDVFIVRSFVLEWINVLHELNLGRFCKTIAAQGLTSYCMTGMCPLEKSSKVVNGKKEKPKGIIVIHHNDRAIELERKKKQGGRCEIFFKGKRVGKFLLPDFASLYPHIMKTQRLPYALISALIEPTMKEFETVYKDKSKLIIVDADVYMKEPVIPVKTDKLRFSVGYVRVSATNPELDLLYETGGKVLKVYAMNVYKSYMGLFSDWVDKLFAKRLEYKAQGKNAFQYMVKILLNSLSGKWGQENEEWEKVLDKDGNEIEINPNELGWETEVVIDTDEKGNETGTHVLKIKKQLGFEWVKSKNKKLGFNTCLFIYDFVTAYGRTILYRAIRVAGVGNYFMSDTDSILVNEVGMKNLEMAGMVNTTGKKILGMLESEDTFNYIELRGLKDYTLITIEGKTIVKTKGVRLDAKEIGKDLYEQKKFNKPASLINKGISVGVIVETIKKDLSKSRNTYDKGTVLESGFIVPNEMEKGG